MALLGMSGVKNAAGGLGWWCCNPLSNDTLLNTLDGDVDGPLMLLEGQVLFICDWFVDICLTGDEYFDVINGYKFGHV